MEDMSFRSENLYTGEGWLNVPWIASHGKWLNVLLGGRQIGKTYGVLKLMLDECRKFFYLRRTAEELKIMMDAPELSPFRKYDIYGYDIGLKTQGKVCAILNEDETIGWAAALRRIQYIRGFSGDAITDIVFDEAIPERGAVVRHGDGDALLNAYVTINGNREFQGKPPIRLWILANTNRLDSEVLESMGILNQLISLKYSGKEYKVNKDAFLLVASDSPVSRKRDETALMRIVSKDSEFYRMASQSEFPKDDTELIRNISIKGYKPLMRFGKYCFYVMGSKVHIRKGGDLHVHKYPETKAGAFRLIKDLPELYAIWLRGDLTFEDPETYLKFKEYFAAN